MFFWHNYKLQWILTKFVHIKVNTDQDFEHSPKVRTQEEDYSIWQAFKIQP